MKAHAQGHGNVWFDQDAIANTFSFANMKKKYWITHDSDKEDAFKVHMNGKILEFKATPQGLYCCSTGKDYLEKIKKAKQKKQETSNMMDTVQENRKNYTQHQFECAKLACKLCHNVGTPAVKNFKSLLKANMIKNCPVTIEDVNIAEKIFGPSMLSLKGKSMRRTPKPVRADVIEMPPKLIEQHHLIEPCMDTMFINQEGMLTSIDHTVKFRCAMPIDHKTKKECHRVLDVTLHKCNSAGFIIKTIHCDGEQCPIMDEVKDELNINMNHANPLDHVPEAERNNRVIKECVRAAYHHLPFKKLPQIMIRYLAMVQTNQLNYFPVKGGISKYYSPRTILGGTPLDYKKHCVTPFGTCVQANHESHPRNDNTARTIDCICL